MNLAIASHLASSTAAATTAVNMKRQEKCNEMKTSQLTLLCVRSIKETVRTKITTKIKFHEIGHTKRVSIQQDTRKGTKQRVEERVKKKPCGRAVKI